MIYREFQDLRLSALGMGCMRLPCRGEEIDEPAAAEMVEYAIRHGVNYFDTAWGYHKGQSEIVMGRLLKQYPRESFYLASKFPGYDLANMTKAKEIFERQLEKCQTDYFDFYLFHNVCEKNVDAFLDNETYGILDYLLEQKAKGRIRHLGFSTHGSLAVMRRFLETYGSHLEFCQIQLNYLDWTFQNAKEKLELLQEYNLPVWVMEPLRGGKLAKLDDGQEQRLRAARPDEGTPAWAFRFLQTIPQVCVTLSGMSDMEQLKANVATFEESRPLNAQERELLLGIAREITEKTSIPCTSCRYCTTYCPQGLDIPYLISLYNEHRFTNGGFMAPMALEAQPKEKHPSACLGCRSCEAVCPQQIRISEIMSRFSKELDR